MEKIEVPPIEDPPALLEYLLLLYREHFWAMPDAAMVESARSVARVLTKTVEAQGAHHAQEILQELSGAANYASIEMRHAHSPCPFEGAVFRKLPDSERQPILRRHDEDLQKLVQRPLSSVRVFERR